MNKKSFKTCIYTYNTIYLYHIFNLQLKGAIVAKKFTKYDWRKKSQLSDTDRIAVSEYIYTEICERYGKIDFYFSVMSAPIIENSRCYFIEHKAIIADIIRWKISDGYFLNKARYRFANLQSVFVRKIGYVDAKKIPRGSVAQEGRRASRWNRDRDAMSVLFFPSFLSFACWTRVRPLKLSQMISDITVKLSRRCGSSIRVRSVARFSSCNSCRIVSERRKLLTRCYLRAVSRKAKMKMASSNIRITCACDNAEPWFHLGFDFTLSIMNFWLFGERMIYQ